MINLIIRKATNGYIVQDASCYYQTMNEDEIMIFNYIEDAFVYIAQIYEVRYNEAVIKNLLSGENNESSSSETE